MTTWILGWEMFGMGFFVGMLWFDDHARDKHFKRGIGMIPVGMGYIFLAAPMVMGFIVFLLVSMTYEKITGKEFLPNL